VWGLDLATQVDELRAGGSRIETVFPDAGAGDAFDADALDPSTRRQAARGGHDQGRTLAEPLAGIRGYGLRPEVRAAPKGEEGALKEGWAPAS
jgi:hypothetical protein